MKKIGHFLIAVVMAVGMAGCSGGDDFTPTVTNMAGVYNMTKLTATEGGVTVTLAPPDYSGTISLTTVGTYSLSLDLAGDRITDSGTFAIVDDTIVTDFGAGPITDDGRTFSLNMSEGGTTGIIEFTRS